MDNFSLPSSDQDYFQQNYTKQEPINYGIHQIPEHHTYDQHLHSNNNQTQHNYPPPMPPHQFFHPNPLPPMMPSYANPLQFTPTDINKPPILLTDFGTKWRKEREGIYYSIKQNPNDFQRAIVYHPTGWRHFFLKVQKKDAETQTDPVIIISTDPIETSDPRILQIPEIEYPAPQPNLERAFQEIGSASLMNDFLPVLNFDKGEEILEINDPELLELVAKADSRKRCRVDDEVEKNDMQYKKINVNV